LWDAQTGRPVLVLRGRSDGVTQVAMSGSGQVFASSSIDGSMQVYLCEVCRPSDDLLALSQERVVRQLTPEEALRFLGPPPADED
jgi:WD40 repeat protein